MITITIQEDINLWKTHFKSVNDMLDYILDYNKNFDIQIEDWTDEEKVILSNRPQSMKNNEQTIHNTLQWMIW